MKCCSMLLLLVLIAPLSAQPLQTAGTADLDLARLKDYKAQRSSSNDPDFASNYDNRPLQPGETRVLLDVDGPGAITHVWMTLDGSEYAWPRLLRLRIYWDGAEQPSVDVPLGDFFAVGHGFERNVKSAMVTNVSEGRAKNCYWPMPFKQHAKVTVTNEGAERIGLFYFQVDWRSLSNLPDDVGYFHARYTQYQPGPKGKNLTVLETTGHGHYVGTVMSVVTNHLGWFGEGDDYWYVDGEEKPSLEGTGTEDYFSDAWGFREDNALYAGVPIYEGHGMGSRITAYRWHIADPVPFQKSLRFELEHRGWVHRDDWSVVGSFEERDDYFALVAFWYQLPPVPAGDIPVGAARLPFGNATIIQPEVALDAGNVELSGGEAVVQTLGWTRKILFFRGREVGAKVIVPFEVAEDGTYEITLSMVHSYDYGDYRVTLDDEKEGSGLPLYSADTVTGKEHRLPRVQLRKGAHWLTFTAAGKNDRSSGYFLGLDAIVLSRTPDLPVYPPK